MNTFKELKDFSIHFLRFAKSAAPMGNVPFECPLQVEMAQLMNDPSSGTQVLVVLKDGKWSFFMQKLNAQVPEEELSLTTKL